MGLLEFPNPVGWFESVKDEQQKRDLINSAMSALYSAQISFLWRSGSAKWALYFGEGQAMKDAAVAMYLSLAELQKKGFLTLTVPQDMLDADVESKFQTRQVAK